MPKIKIPKRLLRKGFLPGGVEVPEGVTVEFSDNGFVSCPREISNVLPLEFEVIEYATPKMGQPSILDCIKELFDKAKKTRPEGRG
jgi:hypothetical protein